MLLVEDNDDHAELVRRALQRTGQPHVCTRVEDGDEALRWLLDADPPVCDLILLDLRLPSVDGIEVLRRWKQSGRRAIVPVVVLTTSHIDEDIEVAYENGANGYVVKPNDFASFGELTRDLARFWLCWNRTPSKSFSP